MTDTTLPRAAAPASPAPSRPVDVSWRLAWRFALRELRGGLAGFRIFLACLALGVASIAAVGSVSGGMLAALTGDARAILGADIELRIVHRPATADQEAWLDEQGVLSRMITMRTMARAPDALGGGRRLVELKAVDGRYPLYGALELEPAMSPEQAFEPRAQADGTVLHGAVGEPDLFRALDVEVGDQVRVGDRLFELRAEIAREPDKAGNPFGFGPRLMVPFDSMQETGLLRLGSLYFHHYRLALPPEQDVVDWKGELTDRFPDGGWRVRDFRDASPGVRTFVQRIGMFLSLVGLTALLVGGVGVSNAVRAYLDGKVPGIATLKCLGAPSTLIFRVYLAQILVLTGIGIILGLVLGLAAALALSGLLREALPLAVEPGIFAGPLALAALFGLITALAFSIVALGRARDVPAGQLFRSMIAPVAGRAPHGDVLAAVGLGALLAGLAVVTAYDWRTALGFVIGSGLAILVFRALSYGIERVAAVAARSRRVTEGRAGLRLALANLCRPGAPTAGILLSLGLGLTVLVAIAAIQANLARQVAERLPAQAPTFYFIDIQPDQTDSFDRMVAETDGATLSHRVPHIRGRIVGINGTPVEEAVIAEEAQWAIRGDRGLTYAATPPENTDLVAGQWWPADYSGKPLISLDAGIALGFGIGVGDNLTINILGREVEVEIASLRRINWSTLTMNFVMVFSPGFLESAPHSFIATVRADRAAEEPLYRQITDTLPNVSAIPVREALETVNEVLDHIAIAVQVTAAVTLLAGTLVLAGAIAAGHRRRVYDAVVLKVMGVTRGRVMAAFLAEYGLIGLAAAIIAGIVGTAAAYAVITLVMRSDWAFAPEAILSTAVIATALTLAGGLVGAWRALGQPAAPHLRNE